MKSITLFCTRPWYYLTEILPISLLVLSIIFHKNIDEAFGLIPLMIISSVAIVFIFLFLFRAVVINPEEIKCIGVFSSHDEATVEKDRTLVLTLIGKTKILVELFSREDGGIDTYTWLKNEAPREINLFRKKVNASSGTVKRILKLYGINSDETSSLFENSDCKIENENLLLTTASNDEKKCFKLFFKTTV